MGSRSPTMMKAHVSPGLRVKTKPQTEQRSNWDHPENSGPSPQCGQRLRNPRPSAVLMIFEREGVIHRCRNARLVGPAEARHYFHLSTFSIFPLSGAVPARGYDKECSAENVQFGGVSPTTCRPSSSPGRPRNSAEAAIP